jgi:hypothetical protein
MTESHEYEQYGRDALEGTRSGWVRWRDEGYGSTVAVVVSGEVGEPLGESNTAVAERILGEYLESGDAEVFTVGRSGRTWLRGVAVRVFDDAGEVTPAWRAAVDLVVIPLEDYPILDEWDYSDREWSVTYDSLRLDYGDGADLVVEAISEIGHASVQEYIGDHDEVVQVVEEYLASGRLGDSPVVLGGLVHYIEQRLGDLDIPTLAALVAEEVKA